MGNWSDIAKNHQVRKKYTIQLGENELVLKVGFLLYSPLVFWVALVVSIDEYNFFGSL